MQNTTAARRSSILSGASEVFSQRGYKAATVRQIAQEAQVTVASIKGYYGNKQAILKDIYIQLCCNIGEVLDTPVAGMELTEYAAYIIDSVINVLDQNKDMAWVLFTEQLPGMARIRENQSAALAGQTASLLRRLATLSMLRIDDIHSTAQLCYGNVHHAAIQWITGGWDIGRPQLCASLMAFNLRALGEPFMLEEATEAIR